jgi:hypothetical protein
MLTVEQDEVREFLADGTELVGKQPAARSPSPFGTLPPLIPIARMRVTTVE